MITDQIQNGNDASDHLSSDDGHGGHGGHGGRGGYGGGVGGEPGEPGKPGEPGVVVKSFALPFATWLAIISAMVGGIYWLFGLEARIKEIARDGASFRENVLSLNTPLSQRVFSLEARVAEIARIQSEVRTQLSSIDTNGTTQNKILKRDVDSLRVDVSGQNVRCNDAMRQIDELTRDMIENKVRIQYIVEALNPHESQRKK